MSSPNSILSLCECLLMAMVREYFNMVGRWTDIFVLSEEGRDWVDWVC